ncbi:hypothetical protein GCM10020219_090290 [Nonomuraea dietziae]
MWPWVSANTRFWAGTSNSEAAARNSCQSPAALSSKMASAAVPGESAVHCRATAFAPPEGLTLPITSLISGPCRVLRTVRVTGAPPATLIWTFLVSSLAHCPL